jgi:hypothetical protein
LGMGDSSLFIESDCILACACVLASSLKGIAGISPCGKYKRKEKGSLNLCLSLVAPTLAFIFEHEYHAAHIVVELQKDQNIDHRQ